jgi:hypothetical protein
MRMLAREASQRPGSLREAYQVLSALTPLEVPDFGEPMVALAPASSELGPSTGATVPGLSSSLRASTRASRGLVPAVLGGLTLLLAFGLWQRRAAESDTQHAARAVNVDSNAPPRPTSFAPAASPIPASTPSPTPSSAAVPEPTVATTTPREHGAVKVPRTRMTVVSAAPSAQPPASTGLPSGAACERSRDCASKLCLAFSCR